MSMKCTRQGHVHKSDSEEIDLGRRNEKINLLSASLNGVHVGDYHTFAFD